MDDAAGLFTGRPADAEVVRALLQPLHDVLVDDNDDHTVRVVMVGDCLLTDVSSFLGPRARENGVQVRSELSLFQCLGGPRAVA